MTKEILLTLLLLLPCACFAVTVQQQDSTATDTSGTDVDILAGTFLGNEQQNYYGNRARDNLHVVWKLYIGKGRTVISRNLGEHIWERGYSSPPARDMSSAIT